MTPSNRTLREYINLLIFMSLIVLLVGCIPNPESNWIESNKQKARAGVTYEALDSTVQASNPAPPPTETIVPADDLESSLEINPENLQGTNIQFWHIWSGEAGNLIDDLVERFNSENEWGITATADYQGTLDDMDAHIQAAIEEDNPPDIVVGYLYQALNWDSAWELTDLEPYLNDPIWGLSPEEQADFYTSFLQHDRSGERRIGFPAQRSGQLIYYNTTWAEELGFSSPPVTPEEFKEQACAAARANLNDDDPENDGTGGWIINTNFNAILGWMNAYDAEIASVDAGNQDQAGYDFDNPQVADSFTFLRDLYDYGCAWLSESEYPDGEFTNRRGLFSTDSVTAIPFQRAAMLQAGSTDQWTVIPFPSDEEQVISTYGPSFEVFSSTPEQELASWLFIRWLVETQNQAILTEYTGTFPLRVSVLDQLQDSTFLHKQWFTAANLLDAAHHEPALRSWFLVRWAVRDAATQLFRYYFSIDQIPDMLSFLNQTANDLHNDPSVDNSIKVPAVTDSPSDDSDPTSEQPTPGTEATATP